MKIAFLSYHHESDVAAWHETASRHEWPVTSIEAGPERRTFSPLFIRTESRNGLWQKERLLNLLFERLPGDVDGVAWIDPGFVCPGLTVEAVADGLRRHRALHLFRTIRFADGATFDSRFAGGDAHGHAWAVRRECLDGVGFYDAVPFGPAAYLMTQGFTGTWSGWMMDAMPQFVRHHWLSWAFEAYRRVRGDVGVLDLEARKTTSAEVEPRLSGDLAERLMGAFGPEHSLALEANGLWGWSRRAQPSLRAFAQARPWS